MDRRDLLLMGAESQSYADAILSLAPVGCWPLGEASGTVARDLTGLNNGTYVGSPTLGVAGPLVGDPATAVTFADAAGYVLATTASDGPAAALTIVVFVKRTASAVEGAILGWGSTGRRVRLEAASDGGLRYRFNDGTDRDKTSAAKPFSNGVWQHVALAHDFAAKTAKVYFDGALIETMDLSAWSAALSVAGSTVRRFGVNAAGAGSITGSLCHFALWDRALTPAEIAALCATALGKG